MERFFLLDKFNTWYDWRLILSAKSIPDPEPKEHLVALDGMSGSLDLSEALSGEITYKDRTISTTFWTDAGTRKKREALLRTISASLHGKKIKIVEPDDPDHYFIGRIKIKSPENNLAYAKFQMEATCEPWRYAAYETTRLVNASASPVDVVICNNGVKTLCPIIGVTGSARLIYDGFTIDLTDGSYKISDVKLRQGVNIINVSGDGQVAISYREATL